MDYTYIADLAERARELAKEGYSTDHVRGRALFTDEHLKVIAFPFEAGQALDEHTAPYPAILHFVEGEAMVTLGDDRREARAGTWIHLPPELPHSIHAQTDVMMLLVILRPEP